MASYYFKKIRYQNCIQNKIVYITHFMKQMTDRPRILSNDHQKYNVYEIKSRYPMIIKNMMSTRQIPEPPSNHPIHIFCSTFGSFPLFGSIFSLQLLHSSDVVSLRIFF